MLKRFWNFKIIDFVCSPISMVLIQVNSKKKVVVRILQLDHWFVFTTTSVYLVNFMTWLEIITCSKLTIETL